MLKTLSRRATLAGALALGLAGPTLAQAQTTIELWSFLDPAGDNVRSRALKHVLDTFEAANPGIKVKTSVIQWQEISPQLLRGARAGRVPDVTMLFSPNLGVHLAAGTLEPLDADLAKLQDREDLIVLPAGKDKAGKVHAVPWEMRVTGIMYRKDLLDKAGVEPPRTLTELGDISAKLGAQNLIGFGVGFNPAQPTAAMEWFIPTAIGMGAKVLKADGTADFASPEMVRLAEYTADLVKRRVIPQDVALLGDNDVQQYAESGRTLFLVKATHRFQFIRDKSGISEGYQMMAFPTFEPGKPAPAIVQSWSLAIPKASRSKEAAFKLIQHWTSAEMQAHQAEKAGYLPVRRSVSDLPAFKDSKNAHLGWALNYAAEHPLAFDWPENTEVLYATLARAIEQVVTGKTGAKEALLAAEQAYNKTVKQ
jgi:ABC-type glycerol-3-phosphate transport system substrate-binding protein